MISVGMRSLVPTDLERIHLNSMRRVLHRILIQLDTPEYHWSAYVTIDNATKDIPSTITTVSTAFYSTCHNAAIVRINKVSILNTIWTLTTSAQMNETTHAQVDTSAYNICKKSGRNCCLCIVEEVVSVRQRLRSAGGSKRRHVDLTSRTLILCGVFMLREDLS